MSRTKSRNLVTVEKIISPPRFSSELLCIRKRNSNVSPSILMRMVDNMHIPENISDCKDHDQIKNFEEKVDTSVKESRGECGVNNLNPKLQSIKLQIENSIISRKICNSPRGGKETIQSHFTRLPPTHNYATASMVHHSSFKVENTTPEKLIEKKKYCKLSVSDRKIGGGVEICRTKKQLANLEISKQIIRIFEIVRIQEEPNK